VANFQANILISLRPSVLDPAGEATRSATQRLGVEGVSKLRIGKFIELEIEACEEHEAKEKIELICDRLLANPVMENWDYQLKEVNIKH